MKTPLFFYLVPSKALLTLIFLISFCSFGQSIDQTSGYASLEIEEDPKVMEVRAMGAKIDYYASIVSSDVFNEIVEAFNLRLANIDLDTMPVSSVTEINDALVKWLIENPSGANEYRALMKDVVIQLERVS